MGKNSCVLMNFCDSDRSRLMSGSSSIAPLQGSIQQLVLKSDPTAVDDQCEEDDPYVSDNPLLYML